MSTFIPLSDDQWYKIFDNMPPREEPRSIPQPSLSQPATHPGQASGQGFSDFDAFNFSGTNGTFEHATNYAEPDFASFTAQQPLFCHASVDDTTIAELQRVSRELEGVKQR